MFPHSVKEDIDSGLCCDSLLVEVHNLHLGKVINNHKNTVILLLGGWKVRHVFHWDGFLGPIRSRQRVVQAFFLCVWFGNNVGSVGPDIHADIMSKFRPIKMFMQHCHYLFDTKMSRHPTVVGFQNHLFLIAWWNEDMAHMAQQPLLNMEISDSCVGTQHLVGCGEVKICLIKVGPSICLVAARF